VRGRLHTATNGAGTVTYTYDALGRVATVTYVNGVTLTYGYDAADNVTSVSDSQGGGVGSTYDPANNLLTRSLTVAGVGTLTVGLGYNARNQVTSLTRTYAPSGGVAATVGTTTNNYDDGGRLTGMTHKDATNTAFATYTNAYDHADRITSETRNGVTKTYAYDRNSQLTGDGTHTYSFDKNGNRTMSGYSTGADNRISTDGTWAYSYDGEGNVVKRSKGPSAETWTYGYDHNDRLLWAEDRATDGGTLLARVSYQYDALGNRVADTVIQYTNGVQTGSTTTKHIFDGNQVYADANSSGVITTRYLLGANVSERWARVDATGAYWLLQDRLGSVREVLNAGGSLVAQVNYDGFGNQTTNTNPTLTGNYLWQGMLFSATTGFYGTLGGRDYTPSIGRWLQEDPAEADVNTYRGMGNDGTNATDPSGLEKRALKKVEMCAAEVFYGLPIDYLKKVTVQDNVNKDDIINEYMAGLFPVFPKDLKGGQKQFYHLVHGVGGLALFGEANAITLPDKSGNPFIMSKKDLSHTVEGNTIPLNKEKGHEAEPNENFIMIMHELRHATQMLLDKGFLNSYLTELLIQWDKIPTEPKYKTVFSVGNNIKVNRLEFSATYMDKLKKIYGANKFEVQAYASEGAIRTILSDPKNMKALEEIVAKYDPEKGGLSRVKMGNPDLGEKADNLRRQFEKIVPPGNPK
jgi:RHS repeat-associated protein